MGPRNSEAAGPSAPHPVINVIADKQPNAIRVRRLALVAVRFISLSFLFTLFYL